MFPLLLRVYTTKGININIEDKKEEKRKQHNVMNFPINLFTNNDTNFL